MKVDYQLKIGSTTFKLGDAAVLGIDVKASLSVPVNVCCIILKQQDSSSIQQGDVVEVSMGEKAHLEKVFTGIVESIDFDAEKTTVQALSSFRFLVNHHINQVFEKKDSAQIVKTLAADFSVQVAKAEAGLTFPMAVLDQGKSVWQHLFDLAQRNAFDFFSDTNDQLVFARHKGKTHRCHYRETVLTYHINNAISVVDGVEVFGESPAGQGQGDEASNWLRKKEVKGSAGQSKGNVQRVFDPMARNVHLAQSIAENLLERMSFKKEGCVELLAAQAMQLCDHINIASMDIKSLNGTYKIVGVCHRLNAQNGYTTIIDWVEV